MWSVGTGLPCILPGVNFHCRAALTAALASSRLGLLALAIGVASETVPVSSILTLTAISVGALITQAPSCRRSGITSLTG